MSLLHLIRAAKRNGEGWTLQTGYEGAQRIRTAGCRCPIEAAAMGCMVDWPSLQAFAARFGCRDYTGLIVHAADGFRPGPRDYNDSPLMTLAEYLLLWARMRRLLLRALIGKGGAS